MLITQNPKAIAVWRGDKKIGILGRTENGYYTFEYSEGMTKADELSKTMPINEKKRQAESLFPVFELGLPEGVLARHLTKVGLIDPLDLLLRTGGNRIGDLLFSEVNGKPRNDPGTNQELLSESLGNNSQEGFEKLLAERGEWSGVAGVQPKCLADSEEERTTICQRWIVKRSPKEYPFLAANEYFCLLAAKKAGVSVPETDLSLDGQVITVKRFDRDEAGNPIPMEDFCGLMAKQADEKYGIEIRAYAQSLESGLPLDKRLKASETFFKMTVLNVMLRNGDAHARNFAIIGKGEKALLAPMYDVCTTTVYKGLGGAGMSQKILGNDAWPDNRRLLQAAAILGIEENKAKALIEECRSGVLEAACSLMKRKSEWKGFNEIADKMLTTWDKAIRFSLAPPKTKPKDWPQSGIQDILTCSMVDRICVKSDAPSNKDECKLSKRVRAI